MFVAVIMTLGVLVASIHFKIMVIMMVVAVIVIVIMVIGFPQLDEVEHTQREFAASIEEDSDVSRLPGRGVAVGDHFFIRIRVEMPAVGGNPK